MRMSRFFSYRFRAWQKVSWGHKIWQPKKVTKIVNSRKMRLPRRPANAGILAITDKDEILRFAQDDTIKIIPPHPPLEKGEGKTEKAPCNWPLNRYNLKLLGTSKEDTHEIHPA